MRVLRLPSLVALVLVAVACAGDAPTTTTAPADPSLDTGLPLTVTVNCSDTGALYTATRFDCTATASGGSGTGYSFIWHGNATEYYDQGGTSKAYYPCQYVYPGVGYLQAIAVVVDSSGSGASDEYYTSPC